jgi:D-alanyl-D-alanine carboxypeptidase
LTFVKLAIGRHADAVHRSASGTAAVSWCMIGAVTPFDPARRSKLPALAALALTAAVGVAACGSSTATATASPETAAPATPPPPTLVATATPTVTPSPLPSIYPVPTSAFAAPTPNPVRLDDATAATLQKTVESLQSSKSFPGLSVAIAFPDGQVWTGQAGRAVLATKAPVTADTLFSFGSISKTFVAALVGRLAQQGTISLDDPLATYVPTFYLADKITVRMLLNHTSGIMELFDVRGMSAAILADPTKAWTADDVLAKVGRNRYAFAPGKGYKYSNTDYVLLGKVVEKATGKTVASLVRSEFLEPLGLDRTYLQTEETAADLGIEAPEAHGYCLGAAPGCSATGSASKPRDNFAGTMLPFTAEATVVGPAGAYVSTPSDLARWGSALYGGQVLDQATLASMVDISQTSGYRPKWVYGLGFEEVTISGLTAWGHRGHLDGFWSSMEYLPAYGVTIVVAANAEWCDPIAVTTSLVNVLKPAA